ncbi:hypothetical protein [Azospirillum sp. ST 5-10]|uniref:hypothetical protein n=1 Tax=unclassified Azospirillum TaxID=2630922 RepID=UPI003F4A47A8
MSAMMDAETRKKLEDALLRKAEASIAQLRRLAEGDNAEAVEQTAAMIGEILKAREFPSQRAAEFREVLKTIQRDAYARSVDTLVGQAERRGHAGDEKGRNEILAQAKQHYGKAIRYGVGEDFRRGVERRVQAALMTSADGVDERTKAAGARKLAQRDSAASLPQGVRERRRAIRYAEPPLTVVLGGVRYRTANWSARGLMVDGYRGELGLGPRDRVKVELLCDELPGRLPARQVAMVVRYDPERSALALDFPTISTVILDLSRALKDAGIIPEPER